MYPVIIWYADFHHNIQFEGKKLLVIYSISKNIAVGWHYVVYCQHNTKF